jgi:hypothetical protein
MLLYEVDNSPQDMVRLDNLLTIFHTQSFPFGTLQVETRISGDPISPSHSALPSERSVVFVRPDTCLPRQDYAALANSLP